MAATIKQLRAFVEIARRGNFTRAAEALSLSQPALTIIVNQFEDILGIRLFDRTTRRVRLTQEGTAFLPTAERLLHDFDTAIDDLRAVAERRRGRVGIAALPSIAVRLLPDIVAKFTLRYPGISVHLHDDNASGVQQRVLRGEVDFGIGSRWEETPDLEFRPLLSDPFGLVCPAGHPLASARGPLPWQALSGHPFLGLARDTGIWPLLHRVAGLPENVVAPQYEVSNIATLEGMLRVGLGITALPALAVPHGRDTRLVFRLLTDPVVHRDLCAITRRGRSLSPAAESLYELAVQEISAGHDAQAAEG
ncbi:MAG: LysR substrate-binding domain-containing protein [Kiloniellales bacterium]